MAGLALWVSRLSLTEVEEGDVPTPDPHAELPVSRYVDPCRCGFTHVTPGNTDTKTLPGFPSDATGSTLGNSSQTAGCSWEVDAAVWEKHHLGGAHQGVSLALDLEGTEGNRLFSCPPVWNPAKRRMLSPF